ncbi:MAG: hypothetical protein AAB329_07650, partial [Pseudomonadota bacterium]
MNNLLRILSLTLLAGLLAACASTTTVTDSDPPAGDSAAAPPPEETKEEPKERDLPKVELDADTLYSLLLGEIASR